MRLHLVLLTIGILFLIGSAISIPNPASVNCGEMGGSTRIVETPTGQVGMCVFPNGTVCEEWALYRGQCKADTHSNVSQVQHIAQLIQELESGDRENRTKAVLGLGIIGDPSAVGSLTKALDDDDSGIRDIAAEALGKIGDPQAIDPLIYTLGNDEDWRVRLSASWALGEIGDPEAVDSLILALNDSSWSVQGEAAEALVHIGEPAVDSLILALNDSSWFVRGKAAKALGEIGNASAVCPLIEALKDKDPWVRAEVVEALGQIGDPRVVDPLTAALNDEDSLVQVKVAEALDKINISKVVDSSIKIEEKPSSEALRAMIIESMEKLETATFTINIGQFIKIANYSETNRTLSSMSFETRSLGEGMLNFTAHAMMMTMDTTTSLDDSGDVVPNLEIYMLEDAMYTKVGGNWMKMPGMPEYLWDLQNRVRTHAELINSFKIDLVGSEIVNGEDAYVVRIIPNLETYNTILYQDIGSISLYSMNMTDIFENSEIEWTTWISKQSHLILKDQFYTELALTPDMIELPLDETAEMVTEIESNSTVIYSNHNKSAIIRVPEDAMKPPSLPDLLQMAVMLSESPSSRTSAI